MYKVIHGVVYAACYVVSLLPYGVLYVLSDVLYPFTYHCLRYRRAAVRANLRAAFPEMDDDRLRDVERGFYRWLCDYAVEALKLMTVSKRELLKHVEFRGAEAIEDCFDRGRTCAAILGHYCNWEMLTAIGLVFRRHSEAVVGLVYEPLDNRGLDRLFIKIRQNMGGVCVPRLDMPRYLATFSRQGLMNIFGYVADQPCTVSPAHGATISFLNQPTPVFTGTEKLMRKMDNVVFYIDVERPRRGKYVYTFRRITDRPAEMPELEITRQFFALLEQTVRRDPRFYLWTHKQVAAWHGEADGGGEK